MSIVISKDLAIQLFGTTDDVLGKEVSTLVNEEKYSGNYEVEFIASGLISGVYFYQLKTNDYIETRKMLVLK